HTCPGRRGADPLNPPLCAVAAKPPHAPGTDSSGVVGTCRSAHGHLVGDAGCPPTGPDAPCAQESARSGEWSGRAPSAASSPHFVEVATVWRTPATEVEI